MAAATVRAEEQVAAHEFLWRLRTRPEQEVAVYQTRMIVGRAEPVAERCGRGPKESVELEIKLAQWTRYSTTHRTLR